MYSLKMSILDEANNSGSAFNAAAIEYLEKLRDATDLSISPRKDEKEGTRGDLGSLTEIIVTGINLGLFSSIYVLFKDLLERYENADVQLEFEDGSSITLKHLTQDEAFSVIKEHLKSSKKKSKK